MSPVLRWVIAWAQILGGIAGMLVGPLMILLTGAWRGMSILAAIPLMTLLVGCFGFSILSGYHLLRDQKRGLRFSTINQALQIVSLTSPVAIWSYMTGVSLTLTLGAIIRFGFNIGGSTNVFLGPDIDAPWGVGLNLVALYFFIMLRRAVVTESLTPGGGEAFRPQGAVEPVVAADAGP